MNTDEYQKLTAETAIYPGRGTPVGLMYTTLGIINEYQELADTLGSGDGVATRAEAGDVLWYLSETANQAGFQLDKLQWFPDEELGLGDLAGVVKKIARDNTDMHSSALADALGSVLGLVEDHVVEYLNESLVPAMEYNIVKLKSRQARGVLGGSGDNR